jgi:hypothetical protein
VIAGGVRALDVTKLTLKTKVDHFVDVRCFQFFAVDFGILGVGSVTVDGVEKLWKTAAIADAEAAIGTEAENPFALGAQVFAIVVTRIRWIVRRVRIHKNAPSSSLLGSNFTLAVLLPQSQSPSRTGRYVAWSASRNSDVPVQVQCSKLGPKV